MIAPGDSKLAWKDQTFDGVYSKDNSQSSVGTLATRLAELSAKKDEANTNMLRFFIEQDNLDKRQDKSIAVQKELSKNQIDAARRNLEYTQEQAWDRQEKELKVKQNIADAQLQLAKDREARIIKKEEGALKTVRDIITDYDSDVSDPLNPGASLRSGKSKSEELNDFLSGKAGTGIIKLFDKNNNSLLTDADKAYYMSNPTGVQFLIGMDAIKAGNATLATTVFSQLSSLQHTLQNAQISKASERHKATVKDIDDALDKTLPAVAGAKDDISFGWDSRGVTGKSRRETIVEVADLAKKELMSPSLAKMLMFHIGDVEQRKDYTFFQSRNEPSEAIAKVKYYSNIVRNSKLTEEQLNKLQSQVFNKELAVNMELPEVFKKQRDEIMSKPNRTPEEEARLQKFAQYNTNPTVAIALDSELKDIENAKYNEELFKKVGEFHKKSQILFDEASEFDKRTKEAILEAREAVASAQQFYDAAKADGKTRIQIMQENIKKSQAIFEQLAAEMSEEKMRNIRTKLARERYNFSMEEINDLQKAANRLTPTNLTDSRALNNYNMLIKYALLGR